MKDSDRYIHDTESYIITIRRKSRSGDVPKIVSSVPMPALSSIDEKARANDSSSGRKSGTQICAPLPGIIIDIKVSPGDRVSPGQVVAVLEAMKMENDILSETEGTVQEVNVSLGDTVQEGMPLIIIS